MVQVTITSDIRKALKFTKKVPKKDVPFLLAVTLTKAAKSAEQAMPAIIERELDRPTPFTKKGFRTVPATKRSLVAKVEIKDIQAKYLERQIKGGRRRPRKKSIVIGTGVPGNRLNRYGNMPRSRLNRLFNNHNNFIIEANGKTWLARRPDKSIGRPNLLVLFTNSANYAPRFRFHKLADKHARRQIPRIVRIEANKILKKAAAEANRGL